MDYAGLQSRSARLQVPTHRHWLVLFERGFVKILRRLNQPVEESTGCFSCLNCPKVLAQRSTKPVSGCLPSNRFSTFSPPTEHPSQSCGWRLSLSLAGRRSASQRPDDHARRWTREAEEGPPQRGARQVRA